MRKRSAVVMLLTPLALAGCGDSQPLHPPYASMTQCQSQGYTDCKQSSNPSGHGGFVFIPHSYVAPNSIVRAPSSPTMPTALAASSASRAGFGSTGHSFSTGGG